MRVAARQLFFVGGAPRSGTTWLQHLLDAHPEISCRGEGLFLHHLAIPLDRLISERRAALEAKNAMVFRDGGGYPSPDAGCSDALLGAAVLQALAQGLSERPEAEQNCRAVGEKTPENVFLFPRLKRLFPRAKFVGIVRDPRDTLTSAWHFFHAAHAADPAASMGALVDSALPSISAGLRALQEFDAAGEPDYMVVSYENLRQQPHEWASRLYRFLGVRCDAGIIARCVERTSFAALSGGRTVGDGSFFRKGISGEWRKTLSPTLNERILLELGWAFPVFGWSP